MIFERDQSIKFEFKKAFEPQKKREGVLKINPGWIFNLNFSTDSSYKSSVNLDLKKYILPRGSLHIIPNNIEQEFSFESGDEFYLKMYLDSNEFIKESEITKSKEEGNSIILIKLFEIVGDDFKIHFSQNIYWLNNNYKPKPFDLIRVSKNTYFFTGGILKVVSRFYMQERIVEVPAQFLNIFKSGFLHLDVNFALISGTEPSNLNTEDHMAGWVPESGEPLTDTGILYTLEEVRYKLGEEGFEFSVFDEEYPTKSDIATIPFDTSGRFFISIAKINSQGDTEKPTEVLNSPLIIDLSAERGGGLIPWDLFAQEELWFEGNYPDDSVGGSYWLQSLNFAERSGYRNLNVKAKYYTIQRAKTIFNN